MASHKGQGCDPKFLHVPYEQRWEHLKPTIIRLYMEEKERLASLAQRMKDEFGFDALYHFRKWGIKKRITAEEKDAAINALGKRMRPGASTSLITFRDGDVEKSVDPKQLKRYINDQIRHDQELTLANGIFIRWNLPYDAFVANLVRMPNHASPFGSNPATPANLTVNIPQAADSPSAQHAGISPNAQLVQRKVLLDRAKLLVQGRHDDLLMHLGRSDRRVVSSWLHDYWMYSFMTAKYWGKGPEFWTPSLIAAKSLGTIEVLAMSPAVFPQLGATPESPFPTGSAFLILKPSQLCKWAIHYSNTTNYERVNSPPPQPREQDLEDETTWTGWTDPLSHLSLSGTVQAGLSSNSFSAINQQNLAICTSSIIDAVQRSPEELEPDSWGFAIMARNINVLFEYMEAHMDEPPKSIMGIHPFHLAASYLDGAKTCCLALDFLVNEFQGEHSISPNYRNDLGHTVLDCLLVNILRSHTSVRPQFVSDRFRGQSRFPGEEVDICGRWDADSPCLRQLYASGMSTIPFEWKHTFCHTSAQAICHSITTLHSFAWSPDINNPSGLFLKDCRSCGKELKMYPLHSLVLTAFYLANNGTEGETMFGIIACLVCMLAHGAFQELTADISVPELLGGDMGEECSHSELTPLDLAANVPLKTVQSWPYDRQLGWQVFVAVLEFGQAERLRLNTESRSEDEDSDMDVEMSIDSETRDSRMHPPCEHEYRFPDAMKNLYCGSEHLGVLWAAIQTELLTYRRIAEEGPWISPRFSLQRLLDGLRAGCGPVWISLHEEGMMKEFSRCGWFVKAKDPVCPSAEEASKSYFMNLEDWNRTSFIDSTEGRWEIWRDE